MLPLKSNTELRGRGVPLMRTARSCAQRAHRMSNGWQRCTGQFLGSLLYGVGTLNMTQRHLQRLRATENHMMRLMLRRVNDLPPAEGPEDLDPTATYMEESHRELNQWRERHNWARWDTLALERVHAWAGHVARFAKYSPQRWAFKALQYRGIQYLRQLERSIGTQGHPKRFHVWRWELQFTRAFGDNWMELAANQEQWADTCNSWVRGRRLWAKH